MKQTSYTLQRTALALSVSAALGMSPDAVLAQSDPDQDATQATLLPLEVSAKSEAGEGSATTGYRAFSNSVAGFSEQEIKDTPFSIKVIPNELMLNRNTKDLGSLDQLDASTSGTDHAWYPTLVLRGFIIPTSANYRHNGLNQPTLRTIGLENKERVEVLKGLAGVQAGFAAPGGIVNYVTKKPEDITELHTSVNQFGNSKVHVDAGRQISKDFGFRINAAVEHQDSHIDNVDGPREFLSGAFSWNITPKTQFDFGVEYEDRKITFQPDVPLTADGKLPPMPDSDTFLGQDWAKFKTKATTIDAKLEHHINDDWTASAQASHLDLKRGNAWFGLTALDGDTGDATVQYFDSDEKNEYSSARLMLKGGVDTGFIQHSLAVGYDWYHSDEEWASVWYSDIGTTNLFNPTTLTKPTSESYSDNSSEVYQRGLFLQDVLSLSERWDVHLGGRYATLDNKSAGYRKSAFTPSAALVFKPTPNLSAYLSYIEGLEQGGTAPTGTTNATSQMAPLTSTQWEAGLKGEMDRLNWEVSVFRIARAAEFTNDANTFVQDGEQLHQGVEVSLSGKATSELTLLSSVMWLDAELTNTGNSTTEGNRPAGAPRLRSTLGAEYAPTALTGWVFNGNWAYTGDRAVNATNTAFAPGYSIFNIGLRHERILAGHNVTFRAGVDNLFDKDYWATANTRVGLGAPRTAWLGMSLKF
jgi:iron complex outermembrane recepter protein